MKFHANCMSIESHYAMIFANVSKSIINSTRPPHETQADKNLNTFTKKHHSCGAPILKCSLQWRHNGYDGVSNRRRPVCLISRLFMRISKKTSKLRVTGLCEENPPVAGWLPSQRAINAENFPFDDVIVSTLLVPGCCGICRRSLISYLHIFDGHSWICDFVNLTGDNNPHWNFNLSIHTYIVSGNDVENVVWKLALF